MESLFVVLEVDAAFVVDAVARRVGAVEGINSSSFDSLLPPEELLTSDEEVLRLS